MNLTVQQRLQHLAVRLEELQYWCDRAFQSLSGWTFDGVPLDLGDPWPRHDGVAQFDLAQATVPDGWPLEDTRLDVDLGGEGLLRVRYATGSAGFGLDPFHRRFPLRERTFTVDASVVARFPFGVPNRDPRLVRARVVWEDPALTSLVKLIELVLEAARLLEGEVAQALTMAAERAFLALDWPSATWPYISRIAPSPEQQRIWSLPPDLEQHPAPLTPPQNESVQEALDGLRAALRAIQEIFPPVGAIALTGQSHLDLAWLWPLDETRRKAQRTAHTVISLMERYPELTYHLTSAQVYTFLEEDDPALVERIKERAAEGRWEPLGGMWVEPDLNMPTGESLVRQLLYGQRYFQQTFGRRHTVAWLPDCFGFTPALPQILQGAGIPNFFTTKLNWSETNVFPYDLFWWEGLDGSRVLTHTFFNPGADDIDYQRVVTEQSEALGGYNGRPSPFGLRKTWQYFRGKEVWPESLFSIGHGDGGGGPTGGMVDAVREMHNFPVLPRTEFGRVQEYYDRLRASADLDAVPSWTGELYLELHRGTYTTQGRTKYLHRRAERDLIAAEVLAAMLHLTGGPEPQSMEEQWRIVLRNEFHDILPGSSIRQVYERAEAELSGVVAAANDAIQRDLAALAGEAGPGLLAVNTDLSPRPLRVQSPFPVPGAQQVDSGYAIASWHQVPALGGTSVGRVEPSGPLEVSATHLENQFIRVSFTPDGALSSVFDKMASREALAGPGNQLWAYVDKPRAWDAWDIDAMYPLEGERIPAPESVTVIEQGPHRAAIRQERYFRHSRIVQEIRLWANSPRLEFRTTLDWHDRRWLVKARFPLAVRTLHATFETAFGVYQRPTHRNTPWDAARFEVVGHRFADLSEPGYGVALLNDGKYGHDVEGNVLGLSLLRSPVYPDPLADEGEQTFTYALLPHVGTWLEGGVLMEAEDLNRPLLVTSREAGEETLQALALEGLPLGLGALKVREDGGGLILRAYEPQGARGAVNLTLPAGWRVAAETNLLEDEIGEASGSFTPFQVRSWLLQRTEG